MKVLVTGASGFVGSALCRALVARGDQVVGLTRDPSAARDRVGPGVELVGGSIGMPGEVAQAARECEVVFHAAGITALDAPARVLRWVHIAGTENVLRAARHAGVERVVHISCADVSLHDGDRMHWDEQRALPDEPVGLFAQTKQMAEELALAQADDNLEVTAVRPALLWGPGDVDGLARWVREARAGGIQLYGGGRNIIATTHVDNLVRAALLAAEAAAAPGQAYYITDAEFLEAREFFGELTRALGLPPPRLQGNLALDMFKARLADLFARDAGATRAKLLRRARSALFDLSHATQDLGYEAQLDLRAAMGELAAWVEAQGGADALVQRARPAPQARDVDAQVQAAGGD